MRVLVVVGSRPDQTCSIGAFARRESEALTKVFSEVEMLVPLATGGYPKLNKIKAPDLIFFHAPALYDRKFPWNAIRTAVSLRTAFPRAKLVSMVHEYAEAPWHWRLRQILIGGLSAAVVVNSEADYGGLKRFSRRSLRTRIGPTHWYEDLMANPTPENIARKRRQVRDELARKFSLYSDKKWVLHPGLITRGKGIESFKKVFSSVKGDFHLILMGGFGPKSKEISYAEKVVSELKTLFKSRFCLVKNAPDETYMQFLLASDLVVLPYDHGLSERRSSFLSAMSCGANVWTVLGSYSAPVAVSQTGVHAVPIENWHRADPEAMQSIAMALAEDDTSILARRVKNLLWARSRSWEKRLEELAAFTRSL